MFAFLRNVLQAELGAPAGLAYDISFNKYGMRICVLGLSQNIASYTRRICRRIVLHQTKLLEDPATFTTNIEDIATQTAKRANISSQRRTQVITSIREATTTDAALEGIAFFKSCSGGVCFSQGDMLPKEVTDVLAELKLIFRSVTGSNVSPVPAVPQVGDIVYRPFWIPRSASSCTVAGANLVSDACGRVPR